MCTRTEQNRTEKSKKKKGKPRRDLKGFTIQFIVLRKLQNKNKKPQMIIMFNFDSLINYMQMCEDSVVIDRCNCRMRRHRCTQNGTDGGQRANERVESGKR